MNLRDFFPKRRSFLENPPRWFRYDARRRPCLEFLFRPLYSSYYDEDPLISKLIIQIWKVELTFTFAPIQNRRYDDRYGFNIESHSLTTWRGKSSKTFFFWWCKLKIRDEYLTVDGQWKVRDDSYTIFDDCPDDCKVYIFKDGNRIARSYVNRVTWKWQWKLPFPTSKEIELDIDSVTRSTSMLGFSQPMLPNETPLECYMRARERF